MEGGVGDRQKRSDKKVDVKPTMSITLKNQLYDFADQCDEPVKDIAERMCVDGMVSGDVMEEICKWLRRDYFYKNTHVMGHMERPKLKITSKGETNKVTMRLKQTDYDKLSELAYALDITATSTAAVLIRMTSKNEKFMNEFIDCLQKIGASEKDALKRNLFRIFR